LVLGAVEPSVQVKPKKIQPPPKLALLPTLNEMFFTYIGDYPRDVQTDWSGQLQGVAHDDANWYFTQALESGERGYLMKFPIIFEVYPDWRARSRGDGSGGVYSGLRSSRPQA
jgi:hypothetical protein